MSEELKNEEMGTPQHQRKLKAIKEEKEKQASYKVIKTQEVTKAGKKIRKEYMSDGSVRQVFLGMAKKKK